MFTVIDINSFKERTGITNELSSLRERPEQIVAFRDLKIIDYIELMKERYLHKLLHGVVLQDDPQRRPYIDCNISHARIDPHILSIGQTFVERGKCQRMTENLGNVFEGFCMNGFANCPALIIWGKVADDSPALAHYIPPIIETNSSKFKLLDGVHRNFLAKAVGTTIQAIIIESVKIPFPCDVHEWSAVSIVDEKPQWREDRFYNLRYEFFRDFKWVGIDG